MYGVCVRAQRTERQREDGSELGPKPFALVLIGPLAWAETFCIGPLAIGPQAWAKLCIGPQAWAETFCIGPLAADEDEHLESSRLAHESVALPHVFCWCAHARLYVRDVQHVCVI